MAAAELDTINDLSSITVKGYEKSDTYRDIVSKAKLLTRSIPHDDAEASDFKLGSITPDFSSTSSYNVSALLNGTDPVITNEVFSPTSTMTATQQKGGARRDEDYEDLPYSVLSDSSLSAIEYGVLKGGDDSSEEDDDDDDEDDDDEDDDEEEETTSEEEEEDQDGGKQSGSFITGTRKLRSAIHQPDVSSSIYEEPAYMLSESSLDSEWDDRESSDYSTLVRI